MPKHTHTHTIATVVTAVADAAAVDHFAIAVTAPADVATATADAAAVDDIANVATAVMMRLLMLLLFLIHLK